MSREKPPPYRAAAERELAAIAKPRPQVDPLGRLVQVHRASPIPLVESTQVVLRHAGGLIVRTAAGDSQILYEDVDQVWFDLDRIAASPISAIPLVHAIKLVDHDANELHVPARVDSAVELLNAVLRACSWPLRAPARDALAAGDSLHFGNVRISRDRIAVGSASAAWIELALVKMCSDRIEFFRRQKLIAWKAVRTDDVPHFTLFAELVESLAIRLKREKSWWGG